MSKKMAFFTVEVGATSVIYVLVGFAVGYTLAKRRYNVYYEEGGV